MIGKPIHLDYTLPHLILTEIPGLVPTLIRRFGVLITSKMTLKSMSLIREMLEYMDKWKTNFYNLALLEQSNSLMR